MMDAVESFDVFKECMQDKESVNKHFDRAQEARKYFEAYIEEIEIWASAFPAMHKELKGVPLSLILEILERGREIGFQQGFDAASGELPF